MPEDDTDEHRNLTPDQKIDRLYRFFVGDLKTPGMIQMVKEHDKLLNDPEDGLVPWKKRVGAKLEYAVGWIGGAIAVGILVAWIVDHVSLK